MPMCSFPGCVKYGPHVHKESLSEVQRIQKRIFESGKGKGGIKTLASFGDKRVCEFPITRGPRKGQIRKGTKAGYELHLKYGQKSVADHCQECSEWRAREKEADVA